MRLTTTPVAVTLAAVLLWTMHPAAQQPDAGAFVNGEILVQFRLGAAASDRADAHRQGGGSDIAEIQRTGVQRVRVPAGAETAAIARYRRNPNILRAEPNFIRKVPGHLVESDSPVVPGDFQFGQQWGLDNTGQQFYCIQLIFGPLCFYAGTPDADIDAPEAWSVTTGGGAVTVAVIDSGIDYTHPDLAANYLGGDDFVFFDGDPMDDHGHGTHVAGTAAAAMNNLTGTPGAAEGVVGVAPSAFIRAYKVCRADGSCDDFAIQQAIARAIDDGAQIINMSLGSSDYSETLDAAVQDAWNAGLVIVAGAGNSGTTAPFYPAALNNVISVAAFDEDHRRPSFSNYGSWVDISAPGNAILSTYPMSRCTASTTPGDVGCYAWLTGTSMATPHVSGAAALLMSYGNVSSNSQVVEALLGSTDRIGVGGTRLDSWTIHGGLNLHDALTYSVTTPVAKAGADQAVTDDDENGVELVSLDGSASFDPNGSIVSYEWRNGSTPIASTVTAVVSLPVGVHVLTLRVTDNDGETATDEVTIAVNPPRQLTVVASTPQATEAGSTPGAFTISRTGDTSAPLTVHYKIEGTASASTDYHPLPGPVTIAAGFASATVSVSPIDDTEHEGNETVVLTLLADAAYYVGLPMSATVTIVSDDLPPDLVVPSIAAPTTGRSDGDIVVTDTTKNQGSGSSASSQTGFYLSTNSILDSSDVFLGSREVPALAPGASDTGAATLHLPSTPNGTYYVIAKADWDSAVVESVETNNTRVGTVTRIGPDLIVSVVSAPATADPGTTLSVSDTTTNQGAGDVESSSTHFYLSTNTILDSSDVLLGSRAVPALAGGGSHAATTPLSVPAGTAAGTYYVIAEADGADAVVETSESNNTKTSASIRIGPDLIVSAVSAPTSAAPGAAITVSDTTRNQGGGLAAPSSTGFYLSTNGAIGPEDVLLGNRSVGTLAAGASASGSTVVQIPAGTASGTYYIVAKADWDEQVTETTETNNHKASRTITVGGDLSVSSLSASSTPTADGTITITDTTRNQGAGSVPESATGFFLSANSSYNSTDLFLGSRVVESLNPSESSTASTQVEIPAGTAAGSYYVIAVADWNGAVPETSEINNVRSTGFVRVGPDALVTSLTAPASAVAGTAITAGDTTKNQGNETMPASVTYFYLSINSVFNSSAVLLGSRSVPPLESGVSHTASTSLVIPPGTSAGLYYLIAKTDGDNAIVESQEGNNTRVKSISITAP